MNPSLIPQTTLVCTLGGQPQAVTLTLDLLLARGEAVDQVIVVYMASNPRYRAAYQRLAGEFSGDRYGGQPCRLRGIPIRLGRSEISEARTPAEVDAVWRTLYGLLADLKASHQQLHLSLTGGRRIMALLASSVAMLHFTTTDHAWHIYTPDAVSDFLKENGLLHAPPEAGVQLIEVPIAPWGAYFPGVRGLLSRSPQELRQAHLGWLDEADRARCLRVWEALTPRRREALRALCETNTRGEAAAVLDIRLSTLDDHKTEIFRECRLAWGGEADPEPTLDFVRQRFGRFLKELDEV